MVYYEYGISVSSDPAGGILMRARNYFSFLAAAAVLTITGAALSGPSYAPLAPPPGFVVHLMDYNQVNGELLGYPDGNPPLSWYRHTHATKHLPGNVTGNGSNNGRIHRVGEEGEREGREHNEHPPSPCIPIIQVWNMAVAYERAHPAAAATSNDFAVLIALLAEHKCSAIISAPPVSGDIQTIAPSN